MTVIEITRPDAFPERNQARFLFTEMVANEYQLEILCEGYLMQVGFNKGVFTARFDEESVFSIHDSGMAEDDNPLRKGFLEAKMEIDGQGQTDKELSRYRMAHAIWEYFMLRLPTLETETSKFYVHQPGRNGVVTENGIECGRKDW